MTTPKRAKKAKRALWFNEFLDMDGQWHLCNGALFANRKEAALDLRSRNDLSHKWRTAKFIRAAR